MSRIPESMALITIMHCIINPIMTDEACFERHTQAVEYLEQGISRYRECLECEQWKGGSEATMPEKITCWCCERENQSWKKKIEGHRVCGFCAKHLQDAIDHDVPIDEARDEIAPVAQNMNPGKWPEKDLWSWNKATNKENKSKPEPASASEEKYQDNGVEEKTKSERLIEDLKRKYPAAGQQETLADFQRVDIVSDEGYTLLLPLTDREQGLLKWIDTLAVEQRRTREQQILWMLEMAMDQEAA